VSDNDIRAFERFLAGRNKAYVTRARQMRVCHEDKKRQAAKFSIGQKVRVISDHDGPDGRWVGVVGTTVGFVYQAPFPWRIRAPSGSEMYASAEMLEAVIQD